MLSLLFGFQFQGHRCSTPKTFKSGFVDDNPTASIAFTPDGRICFNYYLSKFWVHRVSYGYPKLALLNHPNNKHFTQLSCTYQAGHLFLLSYNVSDEQFEVFHISSEWFLTEAWVLKTDSIRSHRHGSRSETTTKYNDKRRVNFYGCEGIVVSKSGRIFLSLHGHIVEISFKDRNIVRIFDPENINVETIITYFPFLWISNNNLLYFLFDVKVKLGIIFETYLFKFKNVFTIIIWIYRRP